MFHWVKPKAAAKLELLFNKPVSGAYPSGVKFNRRQDTQHNYIQDNDTQHNGIQQNSKKIRDTQHNGFQRKDRVIVMLSVIYAKCGK